MELYSIHTLQILIPSFFSSIKGIIAVSDSCVHDSQCTGSRYASLCRSSVCTCQTGYMLIGNKCYKGC